MVSLVVMLGLNKTAREIVKAFDKIISKGRKPPALRNNTAKDFTSKLFERQKDSSFQNP